MTQTASILPSNIVVTGATGFIGQALVQRLAERGHLVTALSRRPHTPGRWDASLGVQSIQVPAYEDVVLPDKPVVIHLAEERDIASLAKQGDAIIAKSVANATALAKQSARIVYASSVAVYGDEFLDTITENSKTTTRHPYQRMKLATERVVLDHGGLVLRLANIYGPGMADNNVFSDILAQINNDGPLVLHSLSPVRDYLWVGDCVQAFVLAIEKPVSGVLNLANGNSHSVEALARETLELAGRPERHLVENQNMSGKQSQQYFQPMQARHKLDWTAKTPIREGLQQLLETAGFANGILD